MSLHLPSVSRGDGPYACRGFILRSLKMCDRRRRVLIAGGGVAGLETLLALRALAADRLEVTILRRS